MPDRPQQHRLMGHVGETAARIRKLRPPDAYKGKGVRYACEILRLKAGKAGGK